MFCEFASCYKAVVSPKNVLRLNVNLGPGVVGWQIEVVAVMRRWRSDGRKSSGTVELGRACSCTSAVLSVCLFVGL